MTTNAKQWMNRPNSQCHILTYSLNLHCNAHTNNGIVAPNYNLEFNITQWSRVCRLTHTITLIWSCVCSPRHGNISKMKFSALTARQVWGLFICAYSIESNGFNSQIIFRWNYLPMRIGWAAQPPKTLLNETVSYCQKKKKSENEFVKYAVDWLQSKFENQSSAVPSRWQCEKKKLESLYQSVHWRWRRPSHDAVFYFISLFLHELYLLCQFYFRMEFIFIAALRLIYLRRSYWNIT